MPNEAIDPAKVELDFVAPANESQTEMIDPAKVKIDPFFSPTKKQFSRIREAFTSDPLAVFENEGDRARLELESSRMPDPENFRKRYALAAYYSQMQNSDFKFVLANLDQFTTKYNDGKPQTVEAAYNDIAQLLNPPQPGEGGAAEVGKAMGGGLMEQASNLFFTLLKVAANDPQQDVVNKLLLNDQQKKAYDAGVQGFNEGLEQLHEESAGYYKDIADRSTEAALEPEWFSRWNNGRWLVNAGKFLAIQAPTQAAQLAAAYYTGPLGFTALIGSSSGIDKYYDLKWDNPDLPEDQRLKNAAFTGFINSGFAWLTAGIVKGKIPVLNRIQIRGEAKASVLYFLEATGIEASQEFVEQMAENITDLHTGVYGDIEKMSPEEYRKYLWNGCGESALAGGSFGFAGAGMGYRNFRTQHRSSMQAMNSLQAERTRLLQKENLSDTEVAELQQVETALDSGNINDLAETAQAVARLEQERQQSAREAEAELTDEERMQREAEAAEMDYTLRKQLPHNPQDTIDTANELMAQFPAFRLDIVNTTGELAPEVRARIEAEGIDPVRVRAWVDDSDTVHLIAENVRPSDVARTIGHEVIGHKGLRAVFGQKFDDLLDLVYRDHFDEIAKLSETYKRDTETIENQRYLTEEFLADCASAEMKPKWWKELLQKIRMGLRKIPGLQNLRFTDRDIEGALMRSARAMRRRDAENRSLGQSLRLLADDPESGKAFPKRHAGNYNEALNNLRSLQGQTFVNADTGIEARLSANGVNKLLSNKAREKSYANGFTYAQHFEAVSNIDRLFENAVLAEERADHKGSADIASVKRFSAPFYTGREFAEAYLTVKEFVQHGHRIYSLELEEIKKPPAGKATGGSPDQTPRPSDGPPSDTDAEGTRHNPAAEGYNSKLLEKIEKSRQLLEKEGKKNDSGMKFSVAPVWTGSAADYDRPDLHYIGTGEGAQVYGWGLYGSSSEKVARWYARTDAERKNRARILLDGKEPDPEWYDKTDLSGEPTEFEIENTVLEDVRGRKGSISGTLEYYRIQMNKPTTARENPEFYRLCREWLEKNRDRISYIPENDDLSGRRNLYRQTFFAGREENLLDWDKPVAEEQRKKITEQLKKEGLFLDGDPDRASADYRELKQKQNSGEEVSPEKLEAAYNKAARLHAQRNVIGKTINGDIPSGSMAYENLEEILGSPKAASEFLHRGGIDGITYVGDSSGVRNYVAFSDRDIRVDEHIRFSVAQYSEADRDDIIAMLKPYAGIMLDRDGADYAAYLAAKGVNIPAEDARIFALEATRENMKTARERAAKRRNDWLYENVPVWQDVVSVTGSENFKIVPSKSFRDEEMSGTFIAKKKETGMPSDELAQAIARRSGRDPLTVEQEIIDFFRDLKKPDLYKMYSDWKKENVLGDREAEKQMRAEWEKQNRARVEDEVIRLLERGTPVTAEWAAENRDVYRELYRQLFGGKEPPQNPGKADLEAMNAAIRQEGGNAATFAQAYRAAREKAYEEFAGKLREFKEKVLAAKTDAMKLQRDALSFAEKHLPKENRGEFARAIVKLMEVPSSPSAKYPEGRRAAEFRKIFEDITARSRELRRGKLLEMIAKRLNQLGDRVDASRKVRGLRDMETQARLNRIIAISRMDSGMLDMEIAAKQKAIESALSDGRDVSEMHYDIALCHRYGMLWEKSADELETAWTDLNELARTGKNRLLVEIQKRANDDERDRNEWHQAVNGMKRLDPVQMKVLADRRARRWKILDRIDSEFWRGLSLDGILEAAALFSDSDEKNVLGRFREMAHTAKQKKDTMTLKNAADCRAELARLLKTDSSMKIADTVLQWRRMQDKSGVFRFVPDPGEKQFKYHHMEVEEARSALAAYDTGEKKLSDFEAEAIRHQLRTLDLKVKYDVPEEFRDGATDRLMKMIQEEADKQETPEIVIPVPTRRGASRELPLTQLQALYLKLLWDQKDIRYKMHFNGYSDETMTQIDQFLLPEVKEFGKWMRSELERDRNMIDRTYQALYYSVFPHEEFYFPSVYEPTHNSIGSDAVDLSEPGSGARAHSYTPGALKVRVYHLKEPKIADALTVFQNHRLQMNHFVTHAEAARKLRSVLLNADIKNAIISEHGTAMYRELKDALADFINGGNKDVDTNSLYAHLYSNAVRTKMAFNLTSGMKQTLGFITYIQEIPAPALFRGMAYAATHPGEVMKVWAGTDYIRNRWENGSNSDMRLLLDAAGRDAGKANAMLDKLDRFSSLPLRFGDAAASIIGGFAVYQYHFDKLKTRGLSTMEARKQALLKAEMATERTQQSSAPFMLNRYQRGSWAERSVTTFLSNQILLWNHFAPRIYKAAHYKTLAPVKGASGGIAALILSSAAMTAFDQIKEHWKDGEYEWWDYLWNTLADGICGAGPCGWLLNQAIGAWKPGGYGRSSNLVLGDVVRSGYSFKKIAAGDAEISDNDWKAAVDILTAFGYFIGPAAQAGAIGREARKWWRIFGNNN